MFSNAVKVIIFISDVQYIKKNCIKPQEESIYSKLQAHKIQQM